jgi:hypothetical protein
MKQQSAMKQQLTAYQFFGVSETATQEEIDVAYKALMRKWHPDVNASSNAEMAAKEINRVRDMLRPATRPRYDAWLAEQRQPPPIIPPPPPPDRPGYGHVIFYDGNRTASTVNINVTYVLW